MTGKPEFGRARVYRSLKFLFGDHSWVGGLSTLPAFLALFFDSREMPFLTHAPRLPLAEFVDHLWLFQNGEASRKERILPSGTIELVVNLHEDEVRIHSPASPERYGCYSGAVVSGPYLRPFACDAMQHKSMLGVHFKPVGAFPFLGILPSEIADTHANLADLWGPLALALRERLCSAAAPQERFRIAEEVLMGRLQSGRAPHAAVMTALKIFGPSGTGAPVRDAVREVGLCHRRFVEVFTRQVGLSPKLLCRILRFQRARGLAEAREPRDWAQLASTCGYFDQSHLINDFQEFSGLTPTEYVHLHQSDDGLKWNHVSLQG